MLDDLDKVLTAGRPHAGPRSESRGMTPARPQPPRGQALSFRKKLAFSVVVTSAFALVLYAGSLGVRSLRIYRLVKDSQSGLRGRVLAPDPMLGFAPIPGSTGLELVPRGPGIPVRFDADGFRVPVDPPADPQDGSPLVLTLGCSYTYGYLCRAEDAYPQVLSQLTGCRVKNAGMSCYGLAQMLLLARSLIPRYRPDYVVVQFSPWLVERAQSFYAHGPGFITTPVPYLSETPAGVVEVHPPVFGSKTQTVSLDAYRDGPASLGDFLPFFFKAGGPLLLHDDFHITVHRLKRITGLTPPPAADPRKIVDSVYREINDICKLNESKMLILVLGSDSQAVDTQGVDRIAGVTIVDAHAAMLKRLPERTPEAYRRMYGHWRGDPPVCVDYHPNEAAQKVIAGELARFVVPSHL